MIDDRIVYGAQCCYWGDIHSIGKKGNLPCCPHCSGMLFEMSTREDWDRQVDKYDSSHPGYKEFMASREGKSCQGGITRVARAYEEETGKDSGL